jgi:gluconate kinase
MKAGMLASQLAALEEPQDALRLDVEADPETLVRTIRQRLGL